MLTKFQLIRSFFIGLGVFLVVIGTNGLKDHFSSLTVQLKNYEKLVANYESMKEDNVCIENSSELLRLKSLIVERQDSIAKKMSIEQSFFYIGISVFFMMLPFVIRKKI